MIPASSTSTGAPVGVADGVAGLERGAALEHAQLREQRARCGGSSTSQDHSSVARSERWRSRQVARTVGQELQPVLEPFQQRRQRQQARAVGGELDRQRQPVQARADLGDDRVVAGAQSGRDARDAGGEQRRRVGDRERLHAVGVLGGQPQRRAAGGEHGQVRHGGEQLGDLARRRRGSARSRRAPAARARRGWRARAARRARPASRRPSRRARPRRRSRSRPRRPARSTYAAPPGKRAASGARRLERQPRLADAAGAHECQEADFGADEQRADLGQLALAADRRVGRRGQRRRSTSARRLGLELGVVGEDHPLELAQLRARARARARRPAAGGPRASPRARPPGGRSDRARASAGRAGARAAGARRRARAARRRDRSACPRASSAASRSSIASSCSSSSRAISPWANSSKRWSASAGPRHSASAAASCVGRAAVSARRSSSASKRRLSIASRSISSA